MSRRIDFHDDPDAPRPNSLAPSVNVIVTNDAGDVLLIRRSDNGNWALPGGAMDLGESLSQAAIRETAEETGITCEISGLSGIYRPWSSHPLHQQWRGPAGVLGCPRGPRHWRPAGPEQ
jgi:8-oxo-dGTP pyrophosphatase MutT (NUDIX family)